MMQQQHNLTALIDAFPRLNVLVIGEAMLDSYLEGPARRICREAPVPIVDVERRIDTAGGAANTAVNAAALGCNVRLLSMVGEDIEGATVVDLLESEGIDTESVLTLPSRRTLAKQRVVASSQLLLRFDQGSTEPADEDVERVFIDRLPRLIGESDVVIVSDYGYGVLTSRVIETIGAAQRRADRALVVDSRDLRRYRRVRPTAVKPNYDEALQLIGEERVDGPDARAQQIARHGERILGATGARLGAITLDSDGAMLFERGAPPYRTYARAVHDSQAAGAGDTFVSALAAALAARGSTTAAAEIASAAASVVVAKDGTSSCSALELREHLSSSAGKVISDGARLAERAALYRRQGKRIVFTNGVFDILHRGHITYLNQAKALGDVLIVGVNSDASVRRLKGETRPINALDDRVGVLEALSCIDHVTPFEEDTPAELIRRIRPSVYVKGGDYTRETLPEAPLVEALGGAVRILPFVDERSTTGVIERIRSIFTDEVESKRTETKRERRVGTGAQRPVH